MILLQYVNTELVVKNFPELLFRIHWIDVLRDVFVGKDCEVSGTEPWRINFEDGTGQPGFMEASTEVNPGFENDNIEILK